MWISKTENNVELLWLQGKHVKKYPSWNSRPNRLPLTAIFSRGTENQFCLGKGVLKREKWEKLYVCADEESGPIGETYTIFSSNLLRFIFTGYFYWNWCLSLSVWALLSYMRTDHMTFIQVQVCFPFISMRIRNIQMHVGLRWKPISNLVPMNVFNQKNY